MNNVYVELTKGKYHSGHTVQKGVPELFVMALLKKQDRYGYEISEALAKRIDIANGTVYPILRKLKADGLLTTYLQEESGGPPRKYYSLTNLGKETYKKDREEYLMFADSVKKYWRVMIMTKSEFWGDFLRN